MLEEIESMPKPEHIVEAEKELLSYEGIKKYVQLNTFYDYVNKFQIKLCSAEGFSCHKIWFQFQTM